MFVDFIFFYLHLCAVYFARVFALCLLFITVVRYLLHASSYFCSDTWKNKFIFYWLLVTLQSNFIILPYVASKTHNKLIKPDALIKIKLPININIWISMLCEGSL